MGRILPPVGALLVSAKIPVAATSAAPTVRCRLIPEREKYLDDVGVELVQRLIEE